MEFFETHIFLNSPYYDGKGMYSYLYPIFDKLCYELAEKLSWRIHKRKHDWDCIVLYSDDNLYEEVYCHPTDISGIISEKNIKIIEEFWKEKTQIFTYSRTKIINPIETFNSDQELIERMLQIKENLKDELEKERFPLYQGISLKSLKIKNCTHVKESSAFEHIASRQRIYYTMCYLIKKGLV